MLLTPIHPILSPLFTAFIFNSRYSTRINHSGRVRVHILPGGVIPGAGKETFSKFFRHYPIRDGDVTHPDPILATLFII